MLAAELAPSPPWSLGVPLLEDGSRKCVSSLSVGEFGVVRGRTSPELPWPYLGVTLRPHPDSPCGQFFKGAEGVWGAQEKRGGTQPQHAGVGN